MNTFYLPIWMIMAFLFLSYGTVRAQSNTFTGKVIFIESEAGMQDVQIRINIKHEVTSDSEGNFVIENIEPGESLKNLTAIKMGYELAGWTYENNVVLVTMRKATIKTILGKLESPSGTPLVGLRISFNEESTITNESGDFVFKLPYGGSVTKDDRFSVAGRIVEISSLEEDESSALIRLVLMARPQGIGNRTKITFQREEGQPISNLMVEIDGKFYMSDSRGVIQPTDLTSIEDIKPEGYDINEIRSERDNNYVLVLSDGSESVTGDTITQALDNIIANLDSGRFDPGDTTTQIYPPSQVSEDIDEIQQFYEQQEQQFQEQNERIITITESLSYLSDIQDEDVQRLLRQMEDLNSHLETTTEAFNLTKENSLNLIMELRAKLAEKDKTIQVITEEKQELATQFQYNILLFLAITSGFILILLLAYWTIRRFKTQNQVIEQTRKLLVEAQTIAKIGSMNYNFHKKVFSYSENFFDTLRIRNPKRISRLTRTAEEIISSDLIDQGEVEKVQVAWQSGLITKKPLKVEFKGKADDGKPIYIDLNAKYNLDSAGNVTNISSTLQDISEKKENELKLRKALEEVEEASRIKEQFLASMSHEIRTPLNAIIGLTDHLISQKPDPSQIQNLSSIHFSSQHLLSLVNDVLDFSKIKAGKISIEAVDFNIVDLINSLIEVMAFKSREKGIELKSRISKDVPHYIKGDRLRINQILINLIGNAIKFTEEGEVTITVDLEKEEAGLHVLRFGVKDTGVGISKDNLDKIFESFEQENISTTRKYGGTGLGLSISRELVSLMGGELKVTSTVGSGSEFYFSMQLEKSDVKTKKVTKTTDADQLVKIPGLKVLCVEDNKINQLVISQYFKNWEIDAKYAETGKDALKQFESSDFDIIFMDIRLPDMDGYEISRKIKKDFPDRNVPIIALTADVNDKTDDQLSEAGMVDYVTKPFNSEDLNKTILKHIKLQ